MGQKINPFAFRLGVMPGYNWQSRWFANRRKYKDYLLEDIKLRRFLLAKLKPAGITEVDIERSANKMRVLVYISRPGMVIGRRGSGLEDLKKLIEKQVKIPHPEKNITVEPIEVKDPDLSAYLVAGRISEQLEKRMPHRRVVGKTMERVLEAGARGIKVDLGGRIGGIEISRREKFFKGTIPLSTLRAKIDYASVPALTRSGYVGVKVWIYKE
ncbi:30S ribosomal protein S3 [Candidatus Shapirobacteria bacterium]|nr:30S ribosomal protein S3 [Candidatus Shapirobacteria bacterium]